MMLASRLRRRPRNPPGLQPQQPAISHDSPALPSYDDGFSPLPIDYQVVLEMLKACKLPTELALSILEMARYWPEQTFTNTDSVRANGDGRDNSAAKICLSAGIWGHDFAGRMGDEVLKVREVEFEFISEDQGWGGLPGTRGSFRGASSWLEASILRPINNDSNIDPLYSSKIEDALKQEWNYPSRFRGWLSNSISPSSLELVASPEGARRWPQSEEEGSYAWFLQANKVATRNREVTRVIWTPDAVEGNDGTGSGEGFVQELGPDDRILVWARAVWAGWACTVSSIRTTVRYSF